MSSNSEQQASSEPYSSSCSYGLIGEKLSHIGRNSEKVGVISYQLHELSASELKGFQRPTLAGLERYYPYADACALLTSSGDAQAMERQQFW